MAGGQVCVMRQIESVCVVIITNSLQIVVDIFIDEAYFRFPTPPPFYFLDYFFREKQMGNLNSCFLEYIH